MMVVMPMMMMIIATWIKSPRWTVTWLWLVFLGIFFFLFFMVSMLKRVGAYSTAYDTNKSSQESPSNLMGKKPSTSPANKSGS